MGRWVVIWLFLFLAFTATTAATAATADFLDWYQVEVILFAHNHPATGEESGNTGRPIYPASLIRVSDVEGSEPTPLNLEQLLELLSPPAIDAELIRERRITDDLNAGSQRARLIAGNLAPPYASETPSADNIVQSGPLQPSEVATPDEPPVDIGQLLAPGLPLAFQAIDDNTRRLNKIAASINRSSRYRLLLHTAWRQPVTTTDASWPILIQAGGRFKDSYEIEGTLAVSRSRFLHVDADLLFTTFIRTSDQEPEIASRIDAIDARALRRYPQLLQAARQQINFVPTGTERMILSRRMRSGTLHFLDQPGFGVLIQIDAFSYVPTP